MHSLKAYEKTIGMNLSKERRAAFNKFNSKGFKIEIKKCSKIEEVFQLLF